MNDPTEKVNYQGYPVLSVRIVSVHPSRLVVSYGGEWRGYIYKNEWSWDKRVRTPTPRFEKGVKIDAVLLPKRAGRQGKRLSLRHRTDPWEQAQGYKLGQNVLAEIIHLRNNSIYVQIEPGVTAIIYSSDLPLLPEQLPEDRLVLGDKVWGTITKYDAAKKRIEMSLLPPLIQAERDSPLNLKEQFKTQLIELIQGTALDGAINRSSTQFYQTEKLDQLGRILLVEDERADRQNIQELLRRELWAEVMAVETPAEALAILSTGKIFDLVLTDLNLGDTDNGLELATKLRQSHPDQAVALMSNNALAEFKVKAFEDIHRTKILFLKKPTNSELADQFVEGLKLLREGKIRVQQGVSESQENRLFTRLEEQLEQRGTQQENIDNLLKEICLSARVERAILVRMDEEQKNADIVGHYFTGDEPLLPEHWDNLYFSAVRDIAQDRSELYQFQNGKKRQPLHSHNFFPGLIYYSCFGYPVRAPMSKNDYALIILSDAADISGNAITQIKTIAAYLSILLEENDMREIVRRQQDLAMQGTLMGTLLHELYNKLGPLFGFLKMSRELHQNDKKEEFWKYLGEVGEDLLGIEELTRAYTRLAKFELEIVAVNDVLEKVKQQLLPDARERGLRLIVHQDPRQPQIWGIPIHLEQVLTNVVLNAIQWVHEQNYQWDRINTGKGADASTSLQHRKSITIGVCEYPRENTCCILISDAGPGIPYHLRRRIFQPHVSQRKQGQGLGLYISRNLTEAMSGRLVYVDSVRFVGSMFALLFPLVTPQKTTT